MNPAPSGLFYLEIGDILGNITEADTSNVNQGMPNSANVVGANNSGLLFDASILGNPSQSLLATANPTQHSKKRQREVDGQARSVTLPGQSSIIVPSSNEAAERQQELEEDMARLEELKGKEQQKIESLINEVGLNDDVNLQEILFPVYVCAECCAQQAKIVKEYEKGAELERTKGKRKMQNNLNAVLSKERKLALVPLLRNVVDLLIKRLKKLYSENPGLRHRPSGSSSTGQPPDDPPSGDSPPGDFGQDDPAPDDSNSGGPGSGLPSSSGGPAPGANSSSNVPTGSMANAQLPMGTFENHYVTSSYESSSSEESDIDVENFAKLNLGTATTDRSSSGDSDDDASREHEVGEPSLVKSETADSRSTNEESGQKTPSCATNEPGKDEMPEQCLALEPNSHQLKSQTPTKTMKREVPGPGLSSRGSEKKETLKANDFIRKLPMLKKSSNSHNTGRASGNNLRGRKPRKLRLVYIEAPNIVIPMIRLPISAAEHKSKVKKGTEAGRKKKMIYP